MRGDDAAFPLHVGAGERGLHRVAFEQQPQLGQLLQIVDRNRRDLEAAPPFGEHEALRGEAAQDLAQAC